MSSWDRRDRAILVLATIWGAVLSTLAGYAETADQRLASLALVILTAGGGAIAASKKAKLHANVMHTHGVCGGVVKAYLPD